jgi:hypothetical protein
MSDEPVRIVFHLDQDRKLVEVFCSAVHHQAVQAGLQTEQGAELARAAGDVCRETISKLGGNGEIVDVTLDTFADRIEVAVHSRSLAVSAIGMEKFGLSGSASSEERDKSGLDLLSRVDRVLYNADGGVARTTLVKFLPAHH